MESDLQIFAKNFSQDSLESHRNWFLSMVVRYWLTFYCTASLLNVSGVVQTQQTGDEYNGEPNLDFQ